MTLAISADKFSASDVGLSVFDALGVLVGDQLIVWKDLIGDWDSSFFSFLRSFTYLSSFKSGDDRLMHGDRSRSVILFLMNNNVLLFLCLYLPKALTLFPDLEPRWFIINFIFIIHKTLVLLRGIPFLHRLQQILSWIR